MKKIVFQDDTEPSLDEDTLNTLQDNVEEAIGNVENKIPSNQNLIDLIYPVGAIYMSVNNTNPATLFGGTWEQIKDSFILSAGDTYSGGATGGSASHTLTTDELPSHTHTYSKSATTTGESSGSTGAASGNTGSTILELKHMPNQVVTGYCDSSKRNWATGFWSDYSNYNYATNTLEYSGITAGNEGHTHTLNSHTHSLNNHTHGITLSSANTGDTGSGKEFSTLPPYLAVYIWKRTA